MAMIEDEDDDLDPAELESRRAQRQRQRILEATADWVWIVEAQCFVRKSDLTRWNEKQWQSYHAHLQPKANILTTVMRKPGYIEKFERLQFLPGEPVEAGTATFNLWRPSGLDARKGDVEWFIDHVTYLFPDADVREKVLDYMALLVREPWVKILFALLIYGPEQGTGKTLLIEMLKRMVGPHNCKAPSNDQIGSQFTEWAEGTQLAVVNELMALGRRQISNRLKDFITEPMIPIRCMYRPTYYIPNRMNLVATSNHANALLIENHDRRWFIAETPVKPRAPEYYAALYAHIASDDDVAAVKFWLQQREVNLNPLGKAPITQAKVEMAEQALDDDEAYLMELFEEAEWPFHFDLVRRDDLITAVRERFGTTGRNLLGRIDTLLKQRIGAVRHNHTKNPGDGRKKYRLWSIRNHDHWTKAGPAARLDAYQARNRAPVEEPVTEE